ncbi:hypothetical protein B0H13DRAFT_1869955 [Mycena leptocephala]|nr:hypothetical protein B0H13DRAFT_1869955 [Mycena leptocephala]
MIQSLTSASLVPTSKMADIPFPPLLPAGHQSQILTRSRSFSAVHESRSASDHSNPSSGVPSPPRLRRASNYLFFDATGRAYSVFSEAQHTPRTYPNNSFNCGGAGEREQEHTLLGVHDQDPSPPAVEYLDFMNGAIPPQLVVESSSPAGCAYELEPRSPNPVMGNWAFGQAFGPVYQGLPYPVPRFGEYSQTLGPQHAEFHPLPHLSTSPQSRRPWHHPFPHHIHLPPHGRGPTPRAPSAPLAPSSGTPEHNVLRLARIGDGQDTRTTVMIKNIPNKMTYIASIYPRKIDFVYLRMDFGTDLLCFAQAALGQKWNNMFSSQKVLQMTYADIQFVTYVGLSQSS